MDFFDNSLYEDLPKYKGKDTFYATNIVIRIEATIILIVPTLFFMILAYTNYDIDDMFGFWLFIALTLIDITGFGWLTARCYKKIVVNETGISLINFRGKTIKFFDWNNIENIHVSLRPFRNLKSQCLFYISTDPIKLTGSDRYDASNPEYIIANYSPEIIHCIMQYWDKMIDFYNYPTCWEKYIDKL